MNKQKIMRVVTVVIVTGSSLAMTGSAFAQTPTPTPVHKGFFSEFVDFFAQKFGLDKTKVQSAVDEFKTQKKTEVQKTMADRQKTRLDQLVKDGKITSGQETAIIAELKVLKDKYDPATLKAMTSAARKEQMDNERTEAQNWAKDHDIDPTYLVPGFGMGRMTGRGMMGHRRDWDDDDITPTQ